MTPIQQLMLGVGAKKKTYLDDVFSTYVYRGDGQSTRTITNKIDLAGEGGLIWTKIRTSTNNHILNDTARGVTKILSANITDAEFTNSNRISSVTSTGYVTGDNGDVNASNNDYSSWTFRKAPGFFDIVTWTGNASAWNSGSQTLNHNLGCKPGLIIIKSRDQGSSVPYRDWYVWHRDISGNPIYLNYSNAAATNDPRYFNDPTNNPPTATTFQVGDNVSGGGSYGGPAGFGANENGVDYVAYVFAGGASTAATARSVDFDGSSDYLSTAQSSDLTMGTGDFTVEGWIKFKAVPSGHQGFYQISDTAGGLNSSNYGDTIGVGYSDSSGKWRFYGAGAVTETAAFPITANVWYHIAHVRSSGVSKLYVNGTEVASVADTTNYDGTYLGIGSYYTASFSSNAYISNFRVVKGTAVYTSSFRPPTEPLTNITNTKVLCCNNSSTTGKTVGPTLTANGTITASSDSPFDDPTAFTFGDAGDQNVIKCGSYVGNGSATGPEVYVGWEPQWVLIKNASQSGENWTLWDNMRGVVTGGDDALLQPNVNNAEVDVDRLEFTSTGFKIKHTSTVINGNNHTLIFTAIRRSDGYVGKPAAAGTNVFAMDTGNSSSTIPTFDSGFPVDLALYKEAAATASWNLASRQTGSSFVYPNRTDAESSNSNYTWDSNVGWSKNGDSAYYQSWMWKRHAGFDVVAYKGNGNVAGDQIAHSLNAVPEMIWIKNRDEARNWPVYHKGLNGGTDPADHYIYLNATGAESNDAGFWNDNMPTSTHFTLGTYGEVSNAQEYIALLFASVDGISKVGYYTGNGTSGHAITVGFQPRMVIIKRTTGAENWLLLDTTRGWGSGNDKILQLDTSGSQSDFECGAPTSTGFTLGTDNVNNGSGEKYIYYAHA